MRKESKIYKELNLPFYNELIISTNLPYDNIPSKQPIIQSNMSNHSYIKEDKLQIKLLGKKDKFIVKHYESKKFLIKTFNHKRNLPKINGLNIGQWNKIEQIKFIEGICQFGSNWRKIKKYLGTRSTIQVRSHAQKFFLKIKRFKDTSLGFDFTKSSNIDKKDIIKALKYVINNNKDENIIEIIYKKLKKFKIKKAVFKSGVNKSDDNSNIIIFDNDISNNKEKIFDNSEKNGNYKDVKEKNKNLFELEDKSENNKKINLFDFYDAIKGIKYNELFSEDIYNDFSYFSKDNNYKINNCIDIDKNNNDYFYK